SFARVTQAAKARQGAFCWRNRFSTEDFQIHPRSDRTRLRAFLLPLLAQQHFAACPDSIFEKQGHRHHERVAVLGTIADPPALAELAPRASRAARVLPQSRRTLRAAGCGTCLAGDSFLCREPGLP